MTDRLMSFSIDRTEDSVSITLSGPVAAELGNRLQGEAASSATLLPALVSAVAAFVGAFAQIPPGQPSFPPGQSFPPPPPGAPAGPPEDILNQQLEQTFASFQEQLRELSAAISEQGGRQDRLDQETTAG